MALGAVLVDRARRVYKEPSKQRVEGTTTMAEVKSEWFKCRLFTAQATEATEPQGGKKSTVPQPQLMWRDKDVAGNLVGLRPDDRIEIDSKELGQSVWNVVSEPEPMRKKRTVIGFTVQLERVIEQQKRLVSP